MDEIKRVVQLMAESLEEVQKAGKYLVTWIFLGSLVGVVMGFLSYFFLTSLQFVTQIRSGSPWLLLGLPVVGFIFSFLYVRFGKNAIGGNNLVIRQANGGNEKIPLRLIPLTLFGTLATHLFGGSVGREGTAVQMGGSVADFFSGLFHVTGIKREVLIASGMAAGFSSVFGTPLAGTIFALEVLVVGKIRSEALLPALIASLVANYVTLSLGANHVHYAMGQAPDFSLLLMGKLFLAALCFGLMARVFAKSIGYLKKFYTKIWPNPVLRQTLGAVIVVLFFLLLSGQRYEGLSTELLSDAFSGQQHAIDFVGKLFYTVLSLGAGFQGGEVTPLFEIGATLGANLAPILAISVPFLAGLGFIGVFAGATNAPVACFLMGIELFGGDYALYFMWVAVIAVFASGKAGIYSAQIFPGEESL